MHALHTLIVDECRLDTWEERLDISQGRKSLDELLSLISQNARRFAGGAETFSWDGVIIRGVCGSPKASVVLCLYIRRRTIAYVLIRVAGYQQNES